jgi:GNAT superfamily N-acetyltransferase
MIRPCTRADIPVINAIINEAAQKYRHAIPADCWHEPYMSPEALLSELHAGVSFTGWKETGELVGVMGIQPVRDVTLIRHAYVRSSHQGRGIGRGLIDAVRRQVQTRLLVGTWADALWAVRFYERNGFVLVPPDDRDRLLQTYWTIPARQREVSVVLANSTDGFTATSDTQPGQPSAAP